MSRHSKEQTAILQEKLTGALVGLARATEGNDHLISNSTTAVMIEGLFATSANTTFDYDAILTVLKKAANEKHKLVPDCSMCACPCGRTSDYDMNELWNAKEEIRSLKSSILFGIQEIAEFFYPAVMSNLPDSVVHFLYKALFSLGTEDWDAEQLLPILNELQEVKNKLL